MSNGFTVTSQQGYIHVRYTPNYEITLETMSATCAELMEICREKRCSRVILEAHSPIRKLDTTGAFESGTRLARIDPGLAVALLFYDYETDELTEFFKTVAHNRGVRVEYFTEKDKALEWLNIPRSGALQAKG